MLVNHVAECNCATTVSAPLGFSNDLHQGWPVQTVGSVAMWARYGPTPQNTHAHGLQIRNEARSGARQATVGVR